MIDAGARWVLFCHLHAQTDARIPSLQATTNTRALTPRQPPRHDSLLADDLEEVLHAVAVLGGKSVLQ
jgi:hypothetical protein